MTKSGPAVAPKLAAHLEAARQLRQLAVSLEMNSMGSVSGQLRDIARVLE